MGAAVARAIGEISGPASMMTKSVYRIRIESTVCKDGGKRQQPCYSRFVSAIENQMPLVTQVFKPLVENHIAAPARIEFDGVYRK